MAVKDAASALYTYAEFTCVLTALLPVMAVSSLRHRGDPTQRLPGRWMRRLGKAASALSPLAQFQVEGSAPADIGHKAYVVVANHESQIDPFLLSWLPWDMRWVAKQELFDAPLIGWAMRLGGDIPLRRGDSSSVKTMMAECERALAAGISVMIFPEGTRSRDGSLLPFKDGAFQLALRAGVPVLPIALTGTRHLRPKSSRWFRPAPACAKVLAPIPTAGMSESDVAILRERARGAIGAALPDLQRRFSPPGADRAGDAGGLAVDPAAPDASTGEDSRGKRRPAPEREASHTI